MSSLILKQTRHNDGTTVVRLVNRRHDMSGTDYEGLMVLALDVALLIGADGLVVRERDAHKHVGRCGVVFVPSVSPDGVTVQVRRDVSEPKSAVKEVIVDKSLESEVLGEMPYDLLKWLRGAPDLSVAA